MAMTVSELQVVVGADTSKAEAGLSRVGGAISSFAGALTVGAAAAGDGLAAGIAVGVKAAGDLEQAVANISTIKPEIDTSAVFAQLNEMQTRIPQTGAQLGEALYNVFSSVEVTAEQGLALTEKFGKGAVAAQTDAQTFGTSIMGVLNAYKLSVEDADHVSDVFFNTVNKGVITGQELAASLGPVTQSAKAAGLSVDELGAYIAAVTKEGGPAAQNVNNLNNFLQKVTTKEAQLQLNALGIATKTATGEFRPTTEVLTDLKAKLGGMTEAAKANALQAIFPDAQARQGAMVLLSQLELVKDVTEENTKASGVAEEAYRKMSQTFNAQSKLLVNGLNSILTTIGGALLPHITPLITTFSQWLPQAFEATKKTLTDLLDVFNGGDSFDAAFERLANVLPEGVAMAVVDGVRQIGDAWRTVKQVFAGEWAASDSIDPFVNAVGSIAVVIRDQVIPAVTTFATFVMEQLGTVVAWVSENMPLILATFQTVWGAIVTVVQAVWPVVQAVIGTALQVILGLVKTVMQLITGDWQGAMDTLASVATTVWESVKSAFSAALPFIGSLIDAATGGWLSAITTWVSDTYTAVTTWVSDTQAAISGAMTAIGEAFTNGWNAVKAFVGSILPAIRTAILAIWNLLPEDIRKDLVLIATHLVTQGGVWVTNITTAGQNMLTAITTKLGEMVTALTTWATQTFVQPLIDMVAPVGEQAAAVGGGMLTAISTKLGEIISAITTWADTTFLAPLRGLVATARTAAENIGNAIVEGIRGSINGAVESVASAAANVVRRALQAAKNAVGIPGDAGVNVDVGDLEGRAAGGPVTAGRAYIVGEQRPELFVPSSSGTILPRVPSAYGGGTTVVNVTVQGSLIHQHELERAVIDAVGGGFRRGVGLGVR